MRIISRRRLREFWERHADAEPPLRAWYTQVSRVQWRNFSDVRRDFPSADRVERLAVFHIRGNNYRLIVHIEFERQQIYIRSVLTHAEYDQEKWKDDDCYHR
jgi:mRNA interferase HigB